MTEIKETMKGATIPLGSEILAGEPDKDRGSQKLAREALPLLLHNTPKCNKQKL